MLSHSNAQYLIKTRTGQKGPFTHQQICKLVIKGQLEESVRVREAASNSSILVADIISGVAYCESLENEALAVSIDLFQEDGPSAGPTSHVGLRSPVSTISTPTGSSSTSIHRRSQTKSHKRHELSSRIFKHESTESVQRNARISRRERKQKMLVLSGIVAGICLIIAIIALLAPRGSVQGSWRYQAQELTISSSVLKLQEDNKTIIHANYKRNKSASGDVYSVQRFDAANRSIVHIKIIDVTPSTLTTSQDGAPQITWQRQ